MHVFISYTGYVNWKNTIIIKTIHILILLFLLFLFFIKIYTPSNKRYLTNQFVLSQLIITFLPWFSKN